MLFLVVESGISSALPQCNPLSNLERDPHGLTPENNDISLGRIGWSFAHLHCRTAKPRWVTNVQTTTYWILRIQEWENNHNALFTRSETKISLNRFPPASRALYERYQIIKRLYVHSNCPKCQTPWLPFIFSSKCIHKNKTLRIHVMMR